MMEGVKEGEGEKMERGNREKIASTRKQ